MIRIKLINGEYGYFKPSSIDAVTSVERMTVIYVNGAVFKSPVRIEDVLKIIKGEDND